MKLKNISILALEHYKQFIDIGLQDMKFMSKNFLEDLLKQIRSLREDLTDSRIAEILYGSYDGSEATNFAGLKATKFKNANSLIDEELLDNWFFNLKCEYPEDYLSFLNIISNYKKKCAKKRVFDLVKKWDSYCSKVEGLGLRMETTKSEFIELVLRGTLIENASFKIFCENVSHVGFVAKFLVVYKYLNRAVCPICSRINRSTPYQDFVKAAEKKNGKFKFTEKELKIIK